MDDELFGGLFDERAEATAVAERPPEPESEPEPKPAAVVKPAAKTQAGDVVFDIETGPVDSAALEELFDFDETKVKGFELTGRTFDPAAVKTGNLKDPAKIDAKIDEARKAHEKAVADATVRLAQAREEAWLAFVERAPLSAITGQVLAIGYHCGNLPRIDAVSGTVSEAAIINDFWQAFLSATSAGMRMVGHNIYLFDLPFLTRRSWFLGVPIPPEAFTFTGGRWQWNRLFVDTMAVWSCGVYGERISLDHAAQFFGSDRKTGSGADFHRLFNGTPEQRQQALDYLTRDLKITRQVAVKMGVL